MAKKQFKTIYDIKIKKSSLGVTKQLTVPGMALTNSEHLKRQRMGLSEQTMKVIFDPDDIFPDVRAMDLIDKKKAIGQARKTVQQLRTARENYIADLAAKKKEAEAEAEKQREAKINDMIIKSKTPL